jgi:glucans biosynthesis protein C
MKREYFIDYLRVALTILVIVHHTAIGYGASGGWCYVTSEIISGWPQLALSVMLTVNQAWFMSLFFFISAYFMTDSYDRKGFSGFLKNRFIRLGIPLVIYCTLVNPALLYFIDLHRGFEPGSLFSYIINRNIKYPNTSHLWFVFSLLVFETVYAFYRKYLKSGSGFAITNVAPRNRQMLLFVAAMAVIAFVVRIVYPIGGKNFIGLQFGYFTLYTVFYLLGIIARRKNWLENMSLKTATGWFIAAILLIPVVVFAWLSIIKDPSLMNEFIGGFHIRSLVLTTWEAIVCTGFSLFFLLAARKYLNRENRLITQLSVNSYTAYIIHPILVVLFTVLLEPLRIAPIIKFITVCVLAPVFCFAVSYLLRLIPGFKKVL